MSAFYASAPIAFALGLMWSLTRYAFVAIRRDRADYRPTLVVTKNLLSRGLVYGAVLWLALGPFAVLANWVRGPAGDFPADGVQAGLFSSAPNPEAHSMP